MKRRMGRCRIRCRSEGTDSAAARLRPRGDADRAGYAFDGQRGMQGDRSKFVYLAMPEQSNALRYKYPSYLNPSVYADDSLRTDFLDAG